ncbi:two-component system, OmpR family, sensor kinase [Pseudoalteromonas rubra]|uniref:histidine kinase n=1 Tax=Pseudoalteromonas rubra TaxID=43658 RepID=A0A8T0C088_9GAMM|nr:ATP-binding protein [Pseudoalteromonas rubra]KAF7781369.1 two-component system, OmpR family, sensor kinase [Pseudoalteromonas rubra]
MLRLLVSLYIVVFASIIAINLGSEAIWRNWVEQAPDDLRHATQVAKNYQQALTYLQEDELDSYLKAQPQLTVFPYEDVAWLPEQLAALKQGEIITSFDDKGNALLLFVVNNSASVVQLGPFAPAKSAKVKQYTIKLLSYSVLALLLVIWLRPLWIDLVQLKRTSEKLASGSLDLTPTRSRFSAIYTLTQQIERMALKTASLMSNQKQLVNAVSHELRTPLARLKFALAMLAPKAPEQVSAMEEDVTEMEVLIDEMLSYARLEFANQQLHMQQCDLAPLILDQLDKLARTTSKQLVTNITSDVPVKCDPHQLTRVIQNLLQNADKYGQSTIRITLSRQLNMAVFLVEDDGPGIPESKREQVFQPFSRLDKSRNKDTGGFGLGLAIVSKILSWHHTDCQIDDSELGGARFTLRLPLVA